MVIRETPGELGGFFGGLSLKVTLLNEEGFKYKRQVNLIFWEKELRR